MVWTVGKRPVSASEKQGYVKEKNIREWWGERERTGGQIIKGKYDRILLELEETEKTK